MSQEIYFIKKMARKFSSPRNEEEDEQQNEVTPGMFLQRFYDAKSKYTYTFFLI